MYDNYFANILTILEDAFFTPTRLSCSKYDAIQFEIIGDRWMEGTSWDFLTIICGGAAPPMRRAFPEKP
jgi:hypothetical protein